MRIEKIKALCAVFLASAALCSAQAMELVEPTAEELAKDRLVGPDGEPIDPPRGDDDDDGDDDSRTDDDNDTGPPDDGDSCRYIDCGDDDTPLPDDPDSIPILPTDWGEGTI